MEILLDEIEIRIIGCLIEKESATPDNYPLSINGLKNACNQKTNRDPVMELDESQLLQAMESLRASGLAMQVMRQGDVVRKFQHNLGQKLTLDQPELAILGALMLRGPQTLAEIRSRCERIFHFQNAEEAQQTIDRLAGGEFPRVILLPRQPGRKERRYAHLLSGAPDFEVETSAPATVHVFPKSDRISELESEVSRLAESLLRLESEFAEFKKQFD